MKPAPLVLLAALSLASCVTKVGSPGADVQVANRSLHMPEVGDQFQYIQIPGSRIGTQGVTVLRLDGRSVLVRATFDEHDPIEYWIDWEDVLATARIVERPH